MDELLMRSTGSSPFEEEEDVVLCFSYYQLIPQHFIFKSKFRWK